MFSRNEIRECLLYAIPMFWQDIKEMKNHHDRSAEELALFAVEFFRYVDSRSALTADVQKLIKWEVMLGIPVDTSKSLSERRSVVIAKLRGIGTVTKELVKLTAESFEFGEVEVIEGDGTVTIKFVSELGLPPDLSDIQKALRDIVPAHLEIIYDFKYNTYDVVKAAYGTYNDLTASGLTYTEILTSDLGGA
ncbi:YmfQ family protein [Bacillus badius]|uniref:putative phage tail protein n=1 Tax=Bacillus badius TaxID=1455 RepID=UPI001CBF39B0|nr:putative phage tail protein [Bacillus badius]UAT29399.1 YmfQ family protein [Bacillus badius]